MTRDTALRTQISMLIFITTNGVVFGAGLITVLMVPALNANAGFWIAVVVVASVVITAPFAWLMAPRLRASYWRQRQLRLRAPLGPTQTRAF